VAQLSIPPICPHCQKPVEPGQPHRVCGFDLRSGIPTNLTGHAACAVGRQPVIIRATS
jgi:hypothetical protein